MQATTSDRCPCRRPAVILLCRTRLAGNLLPGVQPPFHRHQGWCVSSHEARPQGLAMRRLLLSISGRRIVAERGCAVIWRANNPASHEPRPAAGSPSTCVARGLEIAVWRSMTALRVWASLRRRATGVMSRGMSSCERRMKSTPCLCSCSGRPGWSTLISNTPVARWPKQARYVRSNLSGSSTRNQFAV